jgi:hypothetical protein
MRAGFSIMEALVAIAIIAIATIPLFELQRSLARSTARLQTTTERLDVEASALSFLQVVDPIAQPTGRLEIGAWNLAWAAEPIATEINADGYLGPGIYSIYLYEIEAELTRGSIQRTFTVRRLAWQQSRNPLDF